MGYFDGNLGDGERIIIKSRPTWWILWKPLAPAVVITALLLVAAAALAGAPQAATSPGLPADFAQTALGIMLVPVAVVVLLAGLVLCIPFAVRILTTEVVLTDRRVAYKRGWLNTTVLSVPLGKVNSNEVSQGVLGHMLNYGTLEVTSATSDDKDNITVVGLQNANRFRDEANEAIAQTGAKQA